MPKKVLSKWQQNIKQHAQKVKTYNFGHVKNVEGKTRLWPMLSKLYLRKHFSILRWKISLSNF